MWKIMVSCEHGGNDIPAEWKTLFNGAEKVLNSHRGYDYGALKLYEKVSEKIADYSNFSTTTRLLIDLNRSTDKPTLFSEYTSKLPEVDKIKIQQDYYQPYRKGFAEFADQSIRNGDKVLLLSIHSFTPVLDGVARNTDIGILFHPDFKEERSLALRLKRAVEKQADYWKLRFNYPYKGKPDGHVAYFRQKYGEQFAGIEIEMGYNIAYPEGIETLSDIICNVVCKMKTQNQPIQHNEST